MPRRAIPTRERTGDAQKINGESRDSGCSCHRPVIRWIRSRRGYGSGGARMGRLFRLEWHLYQCQLVQRLRLWRIPWLWVRGLPRLLPAATTSATASTPAAILSGLRQWLRLSLLKTESAESRANTPCLVACKGRDTELSLNWYQPDISQIIYL